MPKKTKAAEISFDDVKAFLADNLNEEMAEAFSTLIENSLGETISTLTTSTVDDDDPNEDEGSDLFGGESEGEEDETKAPWDGLEDEQLVALAAELDIEETKTKKIVKALEAMIQEPRGAKKIAKALDAIGVNAEEEEQEEPAPKAKAGKGKAAAAPAGKGKGGKPAKKKGINLDLTSVSEESLEAAQGEWEGYNDKDGFAHLESYYSTGSFKKAKPTGALDAAIRADALVADLNGEELSALEAAYEAATEEAYAYEKGVRAEAKKKEAIIYALVAHAVDQA